MADQKLYDNMNRLIGVIKDKGNGRIEIWDNMNRYLGYYDSKNNKTWDNMNRSIGTGNLLTTLLR